MATRKTPLREGIRKWMTSQAVHTDGPVDMHVTFLANKFSTPEATMRAVLQAMAAEPGRGLHKLNANHYEYRSDERAKVRKPTDSQVRNRVYAYMMKQAPDTLHASQEVARMVDALPASVNAALRWLAIRDYIPLEAVSRGLYRRLPGNVPDLDGDEVYEEPPLTPAEMREEQQSYEALERARLVPTPAEVAAAAALRRTASRQDQFSEPEDEDDPDFVPPGVLGMLQHTAAEQERPTPRLDETMRQPEAVKYHLTRIATTGTGTVLAEDDSGGLYEVTILRPPRN